MPNIKIDFLGNLNLGVFSRFSNDLLSPNLYIKIAPITNKVPVTENINIGLSIYLIVKNALKAPIREPKLKAA